MYDLGARAMHHDESLHGLYSWYLYVGRGYVHDPMMHGPFLFHITALSYLLFGDSEVTFRLPLVVLGTAAVFLPYFLRRELGTFGAVAATLMLAFGPAFFYFSRFGHNEAYIVFQTVLTVVGIFGWIRTRNSAYLYAGVVGIALMFSTKVVSYMFGFMVFLFFVATMLIERYSPFDESVIDAVRDIGWRRAGICAGIFAGIAVTLYTTFFTNLDGLCTMIYSPHFVGACAGKQGMLDYWIAQQGVSRGSQPWFYYFFLIPLYEIVPLVLALAAPFTARRPRSLFFWFCAWWALYSIGLYTYAGEKMPWLIVHLVLPLIFLGALGADEPLSRLRRPWGLLPRQWAITGLTLLAIAVSIAFLTVGGQDAVLGIVAQSNTLRQLALGLLVIGIVSGIVQVARRLGWAKAFGAVAAGIMTILVVYAIHTGWQLVYKNGDTPVEMLVYVQSSPDVPFIASEVERIGNQLGTRKDVPILIDNGYSDTVDGAQVVHEGASWPFEWYFRDDKNKQYFSRTLPGDFSSSKYPVLIIMGTNLDPVKDQLTGYTGNKFRLNWWYPEDYKQLKQDSFPFIDLKTIGWTLTDPVQRQKLMQYIVYRKLMSEDRGQGLGAREMWFYVRNDLVGAGELSGAAPSGVIPSAGAPLAANAPISQLAVANAAPYGLGALKDPKGVATDGAGRIYVVDGANTNVTVFNPDGSVARQWGSKGTGEGQFTEPWGIAVGPDGTVFVADTWNHRIQKFSSDGRFIQAWGSTEIGSATGQFYGPRDLAVSPTGQLLGQFREPVGITVDSQGRIYVADTWNQRIQVFDASFQPLAQFPIAGWSSQSLVNKPYLAVAPDGAIYATVPELQRVLRLKDGITSALTLPASPKLSQPIGVAVDAQGRVVVADAQGADVVAYTIAQPVFGAPAGAEEPDSADQGA
jgi:uncharacterized protein (TIGR03663 family)